ncbi:MAG: peptidoglycan editing factor PgeF [Hyphomicrobiales bacterium]
MIKSRRLSRVKGVSHGFFTREGGTSDGLYASLNCGFGSGDDKERVAANRARVAKKLAAAPERLLTVWQSHSPIVVQAREPWDVRKPPEGDAIVTNVPGLAVGVLTADCSPVLFADATMGIVAAAHAGWKGALGGVLEATLDEIEKLGGHRRHVTVAIGPTISQASYEVDDGFRKRFLDSEPGNHRFFAEGKREGHWQFDLPGYVRFRLEAVGVRTIEDLSICTYADEARFYSFRRTTHRGEQDYGRQISAIMLKD